MSSTQTSTIRKSSSSTLVHVPLPPSNNLYCGRPIIKCTQGNQKQSPCTQTHRTSRESATTLRAARAWKREKQTHEVSSTGFALRRHCQSHCRARALEDSSRRARTRTLLQLALHRPEPVSRARPSDACRCRCCLHSDMAKVTLYTLLCQIRGAANFKNKHHRVAFKVRRLGARIPPAALEDCARTDSEKCSTSSH